MSAIERAIGFLAAARDRHGLWADFFLAAGWGDEWVSAYVGAALAELHDRRASALALACWQALSASRAGEDGWGYNAGVPADGDSTLWALRLAEGLGCSDWPRARRAQAFLGRHQGPDGGVATYVDDGPIRRFVGAAPGASFSGWGAPQVCVTAAAAGLPQRRLLACDFLRPLQQPDGRWQSYWWCEDEYATALAAEALASSGDEGDRERVLRAADWAARSLGADGGAPSPLQPKGSAFATALALRAMLAAGSGRFAPQIDAAAAWLRQHQREDGSWAPSAGLRLPPPALLRAEAYENWALGGLIEGSIAPERRGLFTTATALAALAAMS